MTSSLLSSLRINPSLTSTAPPLSGDQALAHVGGRNRYQILAGILAILTYASAGQVTYGLSYLYNTDSKYVHFECGSPSSS